MRLAMVTGLAALLIGPAMLAGQAGGVKTRFQVELKEKLYPQAKPEEALQSVIKSIEEKRFDYLVAHLADPGFVDRKVAEYEKAFPGGKETRTQKAFEKLVKETADHFRDDPLLLKELKVFRGEGEWETEEKTARAKAKKLPEGFVFMKKIQERWYIEDRKK